MSHTSLSYQLAEGQIPTMLGTERLSSPRATLSRDVLVAVVREKMIDHGKGARRLVLTVRPVTRSSMAVRS